MAFRSGLCIGALGIASCFAASPLVERIDTTAFIEVEAGSFKDLTPRQQALAYWLSKAAIAIDPIFYDQLSRFGLRERYVLETVIAQNGKVDGDLYKRIADFTKLFWANKGNHNEQTGQKFLPKFSAQELKHALAHCGRSDLDAEVDALSPSFFDAAFESAITAKSPEGDKDIIQASSNNFYFGVKLADLKGFQERYRLNSRVIKRGGKLIEEVYRVKPPGLYAQYLKKATGYLEKARASADAGQAKAISDLIRYYQTGEYADWIRFDIDWVRNSGPVDFINGFIETYRDARGAKGTAQSFVSITDQKLSRAMEQIAANAQYFEDRAPWDARYKKQAAKPPVAKAVETIVETGDFHVTTVGDNLPNENEIREKYGTKSFFFTGSSRAITDATGFSPLEEFAGSPEEIARGRKYLDQANDLLVAMHEVIGHGSGKLNPKITEQPSYYLKEYFSTLEEARADLVALWNVFDPKLKELGLVSSDDVGRAMYDSAARVMVTQLAKIPHGDTIEEDHERDRQLIARYIMDKTGSIKVEKRGVKTYIRVTDYKKMREGVGMLLAELMRIKAEGDYGAIKALIDKYGVHFDPTLRDEVVARYQRLDLPTYWAGINSDLTAQFDKQDNVVKVDISYPRDFVKQQLAYSAMYPAR
jgi:dipeptidyl-peptidase III